MNRVLRQLLAAEYLMFTESTPQQFYQAAERIEFLIENNLDKMNQEEYEFWRQQRDFHFANSV